jgi:hypothetical protein
MINTARHRILAAGLACIASLSACTTTEKAASPSRPEPASTTATTANCTVKILQNGIEIRPQLMGATPMYSLRSAPFQIEVSSEACKPSIGNVRDVSDVLYLASKRFAITSSGMGGAGYPMEDVLLSGSYMDIRPDANTLSMLFGKHSREIEQLCQELGRCPVQILAFRNFWPFLLDAKATQGKVATFKRITATRPMSNALGLTPLTVLTKARRDEAEYRTGTPSIEILTIHPMLLVFSPQ